MKQLSFDESRAIMLDTLHAFDRLCKQAGIEYALFFGTLIGAMRHKGYIPWDDDIDVAMARDDYERLWEVAGGALFEGRYRLTGWRDRSSIYYFGKFVDTRTVTYEMYLSKRYPTHLWVDIFQYERAVANDARRNRITSANRVRQQLFMIPVSDPNDGITPQARMAKRLVYPLGRFINPYEMAQRQDESARELNVPAGTAPESELLFAPYCQGYAESFTHPWSEIFPLGTATFEGSEFPVPADPDAALTRTYGNWRWVPPQSMWQHPHTTESYLLSDDEWAESLAKEHLEGGTSA